MGDLVNEVLLEQIPILVGEAEGKWYVFSVSVGKGELRKNAAEVTGGERLWNIKF